MKIQEILAKYPPEAYPLDQKDRATQVKKQYQQLVNKWKSRIAPGWYGFDLFDVPSRWLSIIDEFLDYLETVDPNFEIHQIKLKFGGLRFYVESRDKLAPEIEILEQALYDLALIF